MYVQDWAVPLVPPETIQKLFAPSVAIPHGSATVNQFWPPMMLAADPSLLLKTQTLLSCGSLTQICVASTATPVIGFSPEPAVQG